MSDLRDAARQALEALETVFMPHHPAVIALSAALAEPVQEPVAYSVGRTLHWHDGKGVNDAQLYLAPPQRTPLTEDEIDHAANNILTDDPVQWWRKLARAVERAHGIE